LSFREQTLKNDINSYENEIEGDNHLRTLLRKCK
jgi:hypothetical protein